MKAAGTTYSPSFISNEGSALIFIKLAKIIGKGKWETGFRTCDVTALLRQEQCTCYTLGRTGCPLRVHVNIPGIEGQHCDEENILWIKGQKSQWPAAGLLTQEAIAAPSVWKARTRGVCSGLRDRHCVGTEHGKPHGDSCSVPNVSLRMASLQ